MFSRSKAWFPADIHSRCGEPVTPVTLESIKEADR